jgi:single-strand DNA-binding protein
LASINKATVMGYVGRDPEIRSLRDGARIATLSIGTSESWRDKATGEKKDTTEWHRITIWPEKTVQLIEKYVRKGDLIHIVGKIETRKWQDQQGQDRYSTEIQVRAFGGEVTLIGRVERNNRLAEREPGDEGGYDQPARSPAPRNRNDDLDDKIPFASNDLAVEPYLYLKQRAIL